MGILIGIAGGSGAGKSTLLARLVSRLPDVCIIDLDSYYLDRGDTPADVRAHLNYDEPAAFDLPLLMDHLRHLAAGEPVDKPSYSFETHTRVGTNPIVPASMTVVEGTVALWWPELRAVLDATFFIDVPADLRLLRRVGRDVAERRRTIESVTVQYLHTVRPMHQRYVEPTKAYADHIIDNSGAVDNGVEQTLGLILPLLKDHGHRQRHTGGDTDELR